MGWLRKGEREKWWICMPICMNVVKMELSLLSFAKEEVSGYVYCLIILSPSLSLHIFGIAHTHTYLIHKYKTSMDQYYSEYSQLYHHHLCQSKSSRQNTSKTVVIAAAVLAVSVSVSVYVFNVLAWSFSGCTRIKRWGFQRRIIFLISYAFVIGIAFSTYITTIHHLIHMRVYRIVVIPLDTTCVEYVCMRLLIITRLIKLLGSIWTQAMITSFTLVLNKMDER